MKEKLKITPIAIPKTKQKKLAAAYKSNARVQTTKTNASLRHQRKTVKRETSREMAGDRNRPVSLLLEKKEKKKMMIMFILFFQPNGTHKCTSSLVPISQTSE